MVKKSLKHAVSIVVFLSLLSVASPVKASSLGGSCKKPGQASGTSKRPLVCKRVSGKLKWTLASRTPGELLIPTSARFFSSLGIALTWSIPIDKGSSAVTGYRIEFQRTDTPWLFAANAVSSSYSTYIKADELAGARYRFRVAAINSAGVGVFSESNWVDYTTTSGSGSSSITVPSSNISPSTTTSSGTIATTTTSVASTGTVSQQNAKSRATSYLRSSSFSRSGLIGQLQYDGFSIDDATYGVDALNTNWNAQAVKKATSYLRTSSFSRSGLIDQMIFEGFSSSESIYGVDALNTDWNLQAAKKAASYLQSSSFTRGSLISQLLFEGFSQSQAEYGVSTTGL